MVGGEDLAEDVGEHNQENLCNTRKEKKERKASWNPAEVLKQRVSKAQQKRQVDVTCPLRGLGKTPLQ
jgi:hypothetical protein